MPVLVAGLAQRVCGWFRLHDFEPSHVSPYDSEIQGRAVRIVFLSEVCRRCHATSMQVRIEEVQG